MGRSREGMSKKGEGVGRKGTVCRLTPSPYRLFCHSFAVFLPFASVWKRKGNGCYAGYFEHYSLSLAGLIATKTLAKFTT